MSYNPELVIDPSAVAPESIEMIIVPRSRDIGGFSVRRALPAPKRQLVGPFIFFDQMGPAEFISGAGGIDVRPHPHIGLATVTYLYKGEFQHRDSLGTNQMIYPGEVNWMVSGSGVTHSERTSEATRRNPHSLFGIQTWVALPEANEDDSPSFEHVAKPGLPVLEDSGARVTLIVGRAWGERAPVTTFTDMFYADAVLGPGVVVPLPDDHEDRGVYVTDGSVEVAGDVFEAGRMMVFRPGDPIALRAGSRGARVMLLGGETMNGPRHIWWNFVSSSKEKIENAKRAWKEENFLSGPFKLPPGDSDEFIAL